MSDRPACPTCTRAAPRVSRRTALAGVAGVGLGVPVLAACGPVGQSAEDASSEAATAAAGTTVATSEVPVGGGVVLAEQQVVVTQPSAGDYQAFSAICTHQGCTVSRVTDEGIVCPCHGSVFSLTDGAPTQGPADEPLPAVAVSVSGDQLTLG